MITRLWVLLAFVYFFSLNRPVVSISSAPATYFPFSSDFFKNSEIYFIHQRLPGDKKTYSTNVFNVLNVFNEQTLRYSTAEKSLYAINHSSEAP